MSSDSKFLVLKRALEVKEKEALEQRDKIAAIKDERLHSLQKLRDRAHEKSAQINKFYQQTIPRALRSSEVEQDVLSISSYISRLKAEILVIEEEIGVLEEDFSRATIRLEHAEGVLLASSLERKKIDKLIEKQEYKQMLNEEVKKEIRGD